MVFPDDDEVCVTYEKRVGRSADEHCQDEDRDLGRHDACMDVIMIDECMFVICDSSSSR